MDLPFVLLNVFAIEGDPFSGNPLAVFPESSGLDDASMQAWARQFNLSESTFVTAEAATATDGRVGPTPSADVRIFTATYEMPFAGHPTLGTAHVVAARAEARIGAPVDAVTLRMPAGAIPVERAAGRWTLRANPPRHRDVEVGPDAVAAALGVPEHALVPGAAQWVDSGVESLIVRLADVDDLRRARPDVAAVNEHLSTGGRPPHVYAWAWTGDDSLEARMFAVSGSMLEEDPATGSSCANLGGWFAGQGHRDLDLTVAQGAQTGRPSRLHLTVGGDGAVGVGGLVTEVGSGAVRHAP